MWLGELPGAAAAEMHGYGGPWLRDPLGLAIMEGDSWHGSQPCQGEAGLF